MKPPPKLTLSEWANTYAFLSPETSAVSGKFTSFKYQDGIMDAVTDPSVTTMTIMKSARVGFTKILDHVAGYFIHQDPSPVLIVQPRVEDAEDYSRTEIAPMLRDTPVLAEIAGDLKSKDSNQRIDKRLFRNGASLSFVGANSPGGFRRITARVVCFDEVDGYPPQGAGNEGDQIKLGTKRTETFWNRKIILGSTPTIKGVSRIEKSWALSDQRQYFVPCPHCGHKQTIKWANIHWEKDVDGTHKPETAYLLCESGNGCVIEEHHKQYMIDNGEWIASKPMKDGHAGFRIWAGYSLFPNAAWGKLAAEWLDVYHDASLRRTFVNLVLGETWEEDSEKVDSHRIMERLEDWGDHAPADVLKITRGVDVQDDRFEIETVGWGVGEQSWSLEYTVLHVDPSTSHAWKMLEEYLMTPVITEDGRVLKTDATCIDTGGHHTSAVYDFVKTRARYRIWAIKGSSIGNKPVWPKKASRNNKGKINLFIIGTDTAKDSIYARLRMTTPGPGYCHFPVDRDETYFKQLTAEHVITKYVKGFPQRIWEKDAGARNEALDVRVYAYAALLSLNVNWARAMRDASLAVRTEVTPRPRTEASAPAPEAVLAAVVATSPVKRPMFSRRTARSNFM